MFVQEFENLCRHQEKTTGDSWRNTLRCKQDGVSAGSLVTKSLL